MKYYSFDLLTIWICYGSLKTQPTKPFKIQTISAILEINLCIDFFLNKKDYTNRQKTWLIILPPIQLLVHGSVLIRLSQKTMKELNLRNSVGVPRFIQRPNFGCKWCAHLQMTNKSRDLDPHIFAFWRTKIRWGR